MDSPGTAITVDANVIIAYFAGDEAVGAFLRHSLQTRKPLFLPTIVEAEVLSFSNLSKEEQMGAENFMEENFISITLDRTLCRIAAEIRRNTKIKSPDAIIAATAIYTNTPLVTRNTRDFKNVRGLNILTI